MYMYMGMCLVRWHVGKCLYRVWLSSTANTFRVAGSYWGCWMPAVKQSKFGV